MFEYFLPGRGHHSVETPAERGRAVLPAGRGGTPLKRFSSHSGFNKAMIQCLFKQIFGCELSACVFEKGEHGVFGLCEDAVCSLGANRKAGQKRECRGSIFLPQF